MDRANIPVVSLQDFLSDSVSAKNNFIEQVGKGLTDYGFFVLVEHGIDQDLLNACLLYTSPSPRDGLLSRMPSSA